jgi:hypothetical protein
MGQLSVGDTIENQITHEEGNIVRIVKISGSLGYVVATLNKASGNEIEALWRPQELSVAESHRPKTRPRSLRATIRPFR